MKLLTIIILALSMMSCGSGGGSGSTTNNAQGNASGVITLSGNDTSTVGTTLDTGFVGSSLAAGSQPDYILIVDKASNVTFTPPNTLTPNIADISNGVALVVTDDSAGSGIKGISMSITVNGEKFDYVCSTPVNVFIDCGVNSITLDIANKTVSFNKATVINTKNDSVLTIDGTLTWTGDNIIDDKNNNNNGGALTDITGVWKQDDPFLFISTLGNADEVYEIYKDDGTNLTFGFFINENPSCYDRSLSQYEDLGGGKISIDGAAPYDFIVSGNTMTVSFAGNNFTLTKSLLTENDFVPLCP